MIGMVVAAGALGFALSGEPSLLVQLSVLGTPNELGTPLELHLSLTNRGDKPYYVELPAGFGPQRLTLIAGKGECEYEVEPVHFSIPIESRRFDFVPLQSGHSLQVPIGPLNEPGGGIHLDLPEAGVYWLKAVFVSAGEPAEGAIWPIWRGSVESSSIVLEVMPPGEAAINLWTTRLKACAASERCEDFGAIDYFRHVRAEDVAVDLRKLLERDAGLYSWAGRALVRQGRREDVDFLKGLAEDPALSASLTQYYSELAQRLASESDAC
jgi:hypothetical protein